MFRKRLVTETLEAGIEGYIERFLQQDNDPARIECNKRALAYINHMCEQYKLDHEHYKRLYTQAVSGD